MTIALAAGVGFLAARLTWLVLRPVLGSPVFVRENYRGRRLPTAAGLVLVVGAVAVEAGRVLAAAAVGDDSRVDGPRLGVLIVAVGLALLGLVDDLAAPGGSPAAEQRGFGGHLRALAGGQLTTGGLKLVGGGAVAVVAVAAVRPRTGLGYLFVDGALVALAANLGNLFDRAPGRTIKVGLLAFAVLVATTLAAPALAAPAVLVGGALALLLDDLHERAMLGDTGANALGGALGLAVVMTGSPLVRMATLAGVAALNAVSERVSFSTLIDAVPPLRALDRAGRLSP